MRHQRIVGTVTGIVGIALTFYAVYSMIVISKAKNEVKNMSSQTSANYVGKRLNSDMESVVTKHDKEVTVGLYAGIALVVIGGCLFYFSKKKKK